MTKRSKESVLNLTIVSLTLLGHQNHGQDHSKEAWPSTDLKRTKDPSRDRHHEKVHTPQCGSPYRGH